MRPFSLTLLAAATLSLSSVARADTTDVFSLTGNDLDLTFSVPSSPVPASSDPSLGFFLDQVAVIANGVSYVSNPADFFVSDVGGGFALQADDDLIEYFSFGGSQLFTGPLSSPTFRTGEFSLSGVFCPGSDPEGPPVSCTLDPYKLTIVQQMATTPEPQSLVFLSTGLLGGLAVVLKRVKG